MLNNNREFFATLGVIISWLAPLVVFFLFLGVPPVRDLLTGFAFVVAIYNTFQLYRWGNQNQPKPTRITIHQPTEVDSRTRIQAFLDSLTDTELQEMRLQLEIRLSRQDDESPE
ncbi:MAG TPA: hypothetical protein VHL11_09745 [Phototrophicaceae bacterium]|jgi:hypothetical protein|nr:hypothetical protein [Phototrophicaceae bacterium]